MVNASPRPLPWSAQTEIEAAGSVRRRPVTAESKPVRRERFSEPLPSELAERHALLEQTAIFYTLPDRMLRALARRMRRLDVPAGTVVIRQGEMSDALYFIKEGHCQVRLERGQGHAVAVALLGTADFFGWWWLSGDPAAATVVSLEPTQLLVLDATAAQSVLSADPEVVDRLITTGAQQDAGYAGIARQLGWGRRGVESVVVGVYSPKGGSGRTTLALNVAGALARRHPGEVLLLDFSFPFTQAALLANLTPVSSLARLADAPASLTEELLLSAVLFHPASLMILPGCVRPEEADLVTPALVARALEILARTFRYIVVDLPVALGDVTLAVLDDAQHVLLVTSPELTAVKASRDAYGILTHVLGFATDSVSVVLNSRTPKSSIKRDAVERRLAADVAFEVGYDGSRPDEAALEGVILSLQDRSGEIARASHRIADRIEAYRAEPDSAGVERARRRPE